MKRNKMLPESHVFLAACLNGAFASISAGSVDSFRLGVLDKGSNWIFSLLSFSELPFGILFQLFYFLFYPGQSLILRNRSHARKKLSSLFLRCFVCRATTCFEFVANWRLANYRYFISYSKNKCRSHRPSAIFRHPCLMMVSIVLFLYWM